VATSGIEPPTFRFSGGLAIDKISFTLVRALRSARIGPVRAPGLKVWPYFGPIETRPWRSLAHRRIVPSRQRTGRTRSTPSPPLDSWRRWTTLAMLAHAFLAVATAIERSTTPTPSGLIPLTVNEFRRLFDALLLATHRTLTSLLAWSRWRRRHQYRARLSHYRRREHQ
jgi:hypothetical protein